MYAAFAHLISASFIALTFVLVSRATKAKAFPREKFIISWLLTVLLLLPFKARLVRVELPQSAAEQTFFESESKGAENASPAPPTEEKGENAFSPSAGAQKFHISAEAALWAVYALGAFTTLFCILYRYCRAVKHLRRCGRAPSERENEIFTRICRERGLRKNPTLLVCPGLALGSSVTFGTMRQTVVIADKFEEEDFALILGHELMHCKRKDSLFKILQALLCSAYWFNPIMHLFIREADRLCEESCDETLLKGSSFEEKQRYCRLLVETALAISAEKKFLFSAFRGGKKVMKQRITSILNKKSKAVTAVAVVVVLLVAALTSAIYLATPPENVKVAYFSEPVQMKNFANNKDVIDNYINNNFYNIEYNYSADSDDVEFSGIVNGKEFNVTGTFVTTSYNGARVLFKGEDKLGNYNVKGIKFQFAQTTEYTDLPIRDHNSGEKARHNYHGWFKNYASENTQYKNAIQLCLNPVDTDDIVIIEIFLEDDFITEFVTRKNIKYADVDEYLNYQYEFWEIEWYEEQGLNG